jgi:threonine/homoserine/homoserine lactone efflux protein
MIALFLKGLALGIPVTIVPSSYKIFLISQAARYGWRRTLPICTMPLITDGPIILLMVFALSQVPTWYLGGIQLAGGFFVLYLAYRIYLLVRSGGPHLTTNEKSARQGFIQALGINILNPNPYILSALITAPTLVEAWPQSPLSAIAFLVGLYGTFFLGLCLMTLAFGTLGSINERVTYWITVVAGIGLAILGAIQVWTGVGRLFGG